ncbi:MAG TPA: methyl-accepting chemotaxis protein [Spirochaetota bacterium]|nr:methyl-accepting chemotaxis protein [Spirochaetota bacterium]
MNIPCIDSFKLTGLSRKLLISFSILFFIIISLLGTAIYISTERYIRQKYELELKNTTHLIHDMTKNSINTSIKSYLRGLAEQNRALMNYYYSRYRQGRLSYGEAYGRASAIFLDPEYGKIGDTGYIAGVTLNGILKIHPHSPGASISKYSFMQKAAALKNGFLEYKWKNVGEAKARYKVAAISYFEPWDIIIWAGSYRDEFSKMVDIEELRRIITGITIGEKGYSYIIDAKGKMIIHPDKSLEGMNAASFKDADGNFFIQEILKNKNGRISYYWKNPGEQNAEKRIAIYKYIPETAWIVTSVAHYDELYTQVRRIRNIIIFAILGSILLCFPFVTAISSRILKPVKKIRGISDRVSSGDLTSGIEIVSQDEFGEMARDFTTIISNFRELLGKVRQTTEVLTESIQDLTISSKEISSTSNQQAAAVKEIVSTMEDSDSLSKKVASRIDEVARIANQTKEFVEKGFSLIKETLEKMDDIQNTNAENISGVRSLGTQIESIWEVVNIINGIADQTKIIAFNAELEASAAGDAGKNFQIVASEVRRLADSTVSSTNEIRQKIDEIQRSSDNLVLSTERGTERIREGWERSTKLREVFDEILNSAEVSAASSEQIVASVNQQVSAFEQILLTLRQISQGIDDFVVSTRATTSASESMKEIGTELSGILNRYKI